MSTAKMMALVADGAGGMELRAVDQPQLSEGEVLLQVEAAGINRADLAQLAGHYPPPPGESEIIGLEAAGRVIENGPGTGVAVGTAACALLAGGGYAERVAVPEALLMPVPAGWSMAEAAGLPEAALTAYLNLFMEAGLKAGETVLIHGGASGVGTAAIRQAKLAGATVVATAGGPAKVAVCRQLGADLALDRHDGPWADAVTNAVGGVDVILDMVGQEYLEPNLRVLATGGRIVHIATLSGRTGQLDIGRLMAKRARLIGSTLRARPVQEKAHIQREFLRQFGAALPNAELKPVLDTVYPWGQVNVAHARMRANDTIGKLVLQLGS